MQLSQPASKWNGVKDATKFGSVCPQLNIVRQAYEGEEACLFINVFTPNVSIKIIIIYI
jgi:carboxylesterase type B